MPRPAESKLVACVKHHFDYWNFPAWVAQEIQTRFPAMRVVHLPDYGRLADEVEDADIFLGFSLRPDQFARAKRLRWIHATAAGVNQLLRDDTRASEVVITNSRGVMTLPMAEHTMGLILALARRFPSAARYQANASWGQQAIWDESPRPMEISGKTLAVVGYGAIGQSLAQRARAMGMKVLGVKRDTSTGTEHADAVFPPGNLREVLGQSDFVVLAVPVTESTEGAFGEAQFDAMKDTAYFINIGRGTLVDSAVLIEALRRSSIAGAALDVTEQEPLPSGDPLWSAPNLFLTPHLSAVSENLWHRQLELILDNLERWFDGKPLRNVVDKERGY